MTAYTKWVLVPLVSTMLVACGGDSSQDGGSAPGTGAEGRVTIAGGLAGATIFVDLNDSSSHDEDEPVGYTDSQGFFGYNPLTHTNYCKSQDLNLRQHCLRLPSLSNLPDEVTIFYLGGVNLVTGEQNENVYRYHVQVGQLRGQDLDLDAAKAAISALADTDDGLDILYSIIDAFYQKYITTPVGFSARSAVVPYASGTLTAQEKFDALVNAGIFDGFDNDASLDESMTRAQFARIAALLMNEHNEPPSQSPFADIDAAGWQMSYIAQLSASGMPDAVDGTFAPGGNVTLEQLAAIVTRTLGLQPAEDIVGPVSDWASQYVQAALNAGLIPDASDRTTPAVRELLVQAAYEAHQPLQPEADPQVSNQAASAMQELLNNLHQDSNLNDSFSEGDFGSLLDGLATLIGDASDHGKRINLDVFRAFLADQGRDWSAWDLQDYDALLLDQAFFDGAMAYLKGRVLDIAYDDAAEGNGRLQLLLTPGDAGAGIDGGRLQACVRYEEAGVPDSEQRFKQPLYVAGDWTRINDNSILLNMNLLPGYTYTRVLQLDWTQITPDPADLTTLRFDMTDTLEDWSFGVLPTVPANWAVMDDNRDAANAACALFLAD